MYQNSWLIVGLAACLIFMGTAHATTWYVHPDSTLNSIQAGIDSCSTGDSVLVGPGTYTENINFNGMAITVTSEYNADTTIIDGSSPAHPDTGSTVLFLNGEDTNSVLEGFTLTNGTGTLDPGWGHIGGGIICSYGSSPIIINNIITGNTAYWSGGIECGSGSSPSIINNIISANNITGSGAGIGLYSGCSPTITGNIITGNNAGSAGGGIQCYDNCSPIIIANTITNNTAATWGGGIRASLSSSPTIRDNYIEGNEAFDGGGIICELGSSALIVHNTIINNIATNYGGGIECDANATPTIDSCTISNNTGDGIYCYNGGNPVIHYNDIIDNVGYAVFNADPGVILDADSNWWGHSSGPYHPTANPTGQGDTVSDYVDFDHWLAVPVGVEEQGVVKQVEIREVLHATIFHGPLQLPGGKKCKVFDIMGRVVEPDKIKPGIYFLEIDGVVTQKVVKVQ